MTKILYATTNPGKLVEARRHFEGRGIEVIALSELGLTKVVEESGTTLEANAILKAEAYLPHVPRGTIVIGDDTGIEIDALGGEPGIKVRRWLGHDMTDREIINYTLKRLKNVTRAHRGAQFRTVLALAAPDHATVTFDGTLRGVILEQVVGKHREGMPFWQIFYIPELLMTLGQFHAKPLNYQLSHPTHREIAIQKAVAYLSTLQSSNH